MLFVTDVRGGELQGRQAAVEVPRRQGDQADSNLYTPQYIDDMDGDHVPDILVSHGGDPLAEPRECTQDSLVLVAKCVRILGPSGKVCQNSRSWWQCVS